MNNIMLLCKNLKSCHPLIVLSILLFSIVNAQTILNTDTIIDVDGNVYNTFKIGNQIWTVENYQATRYRDGTPIPIIINSKKWSTLKTPAYCWYNNDIKNKSKYGALYNWYAVNNEQLAPAGWHVPHKSDWDTFVNFLIRNGYNWDGTITQNKVGKALAAKTEWWKSRNTGAVGNNLSKNNSSGFSALPAGNRGGFGCFGYNGNLGSYWWSDTRNEDSTIHFCSLLFDKPYFDRVSKKRNTEMMSYGFSVRIVKD